MIISDKRKAIYFLHKEGMGIRELSRRLKVSRNTVMTIIDQKGSMPNLTRKDKIEIDPELICRLYRECNGWIQRVHEKLTEEEGVEIGYSTLTKKIRELGLHRLESELETRHPCFKNFDKLKIGTELHKCMISGKSYTHILQEMIHTDNNQIDENDLLLTNC